MAIVPQPKCEPTNVGLIRTQWTIYSWPPEWAQPRVSKSGRSTVSHNQLGPALGPDIIETLAQRSGLSEEELTKQLSQVLPVKRRRSAKALAKPVPNEVFLSVRR
jgi:hypothetical protein